MLSPLFAMTPPWTFFICSAFILFILVIAGIFVAATSRSRTRNEQNRRAGLGIMAIVCGPLVGACLAWLTCEWGSVLTADVKHTYAAFIKIGSLAGFIAGTFFAVTATLSIGKVAGKPAMAKPADFVDDL